jgi:2-polyprenyl-3-methyl-5-hydroxy-6-metoxy-1,4-benzoquinol methylase
VAWLSHAHPARHVVDQFTRQAVPFATAAPIRDQAALELLVDAAGTGADDEVLDVACGPGLVACAVARAARQVTGIDLTPDAGRVPAAQTPEDGVLHWRKSDLSTCAR